MSSNQENKLSSIAPPLLQLIHSDLLEQECNSQINDLTPSINFIPGEFKYIRDKDTRYMLNNAWKAITLTETWNFIEQPIDSFMFSHDPIITLITKKMSELGYDGHSGSSFGYVMRTMQYIACHGEHKFCEEYIKKSN
jgi:hypothetical protein